MATPGERKDSHSLVELTQSQSTGQTREPRDAKTLAKLLLTLNNSAAGAHLAASVGGPSVKVVDAYEEVTDGKSAKMRAADRLKDGILKILRKEPKLDIFADDVKVIDASGSKLTKPIQLLLEVLCGIPKHFSVRHFQVQFLEKHRSESLFQDGYLKEEDHELSDPNLVVRWSVQLAGNDDIPVAIEAETVFHFNAKNKVDSVQIRNSYVNGRQSNLFPRRKLPNDSESILKNMDNWVQDINKLPLHSPLDTSTVQKPVTKNALHSLKADLLNFLHKPLNWKIFAEDFKVVDQWGAAIEGLGRNKLLFDLLRAMCHKFGARDVQVRLVEMNWIKSLWQNARLKWKSREPSTSFLVARWKLQLFNKDLRYNSFEAMLRSLHMDMPIDVEVETIFHIDTKSNKIDLMQIRQLFVNGMSMGVSDRWPAVKLSDTIERNLKKIGAWLQAVHEGSKLEPMKSELKDFLKLRSGI